MPMTLQPALNTQNKSIEVESGPEDGGAERAAAVAALRQAASDLAAPLPPASLLPPDQTNLVRFHFKVSEGRLGI